MAIDLAKLVPLPQFPSSEPWEVSLAGLVRSTGKVPRIATRPLELFDRFGAVRFGPDAVGMDNHEVAWDKVIELRTRRVSSLLTNHALESEVDRIRGYLPPVPGRRWVVGKVVKLLLDLVLAVSGERAKLLADFVDSVEEVGSVDDDPPADAAEPADGRVVAEIRYKGALRKKEARGGLMAALLLAKVPDANDCLCKWAEMKGVPVVPDEDEEDFDTAMERGQALRSRFEGLGELASRLRGREDKLEDDVEPEPDIEPGVESEPEVEPEVEPGRTPRSTPLAD